MRRTILGKDKGEASKELKEIKDIDIKTLKNRSKKIKKDRKWHTKSRNG